VIEYYERRGLHWPTVEEALQFVHTELGEAYEILLARNPNWVRNNPTEKPGFSARVLGEELGDAIMMLVVAGLAADVDPVSALLDKIDRKLADFRQKRTPTISDLWPPRSPARQSAMTRPPSNLVAPAPRRTRGETGTLHP
jgi:hypothetical protein